MTPLRHDRASLYDLQKDHRVSIGDRPYIVQKRVNGGMGFLLFLKLDTASAPPGFSIHGLGVALKAVLPTALDTESLQLFRRELVVWSGFRYGTIVHLNEILDAGPDGWVAAMTWHKGSLRDHLATVGAVTPLEACHVMSDVLNGLAYAYQQDQIIHLDLKPENILYTLDIDRAKRHGIDSFHTRLFMIADWGIASIKQHQLNRIAGLPPSDEACTKTLNNMGTVLYMAPERFVRGYRSSVASDVFSVGMIFLQLLTGKLPYRNGCRPVESLVSHCYFADAATLLTSAGIPAPTSQLVLSMIAPTPSERPNSYPDLLQSLRSAFPKRRGFFSRFF